MKLLTVYNVFDAEEFLACSVAHIHPASDSILCMVQTTSNTGNIYQEGLNEARKLLKSEQIDYIQEYKPDNYRNAMFNETEKRNRGLRFAKAHEFTHVLMMDCDEFFVTEELKGAKAHVESHPGIDWWVCDIKVYFKDIDLTVGIDKTKMAFIAKVGIASGDTAGKYTIDWTRRYNSPNYEKINIVMHHYSWVRKDINRKIVNSTARKHIERSSLLENYNNAYEGSRVAHYGTHLEKCEVPFDCLKNIF